jgi:hypothetical protein
MTVEFFDRRVMGYVMMATANGNNRCHKQIFAAKPYLADDG